MSSTLYDHEPHFYHFVVIRVYPHNPRHPRSISTFGTEFGCVRKATSCASAKIAPNRQSSIVNGSRLGQFHNRHHRQKIVDLKLEDAIGFAIKLLHGKLLDMERNEIIHLAQIIWDYHHLNHALVQSDCILVQGSHDLRVAERGAQLYLDGWAPWLILSGGLGRLTDHLWDEPEADKFAQIARDMGVPDDHILIENQSTNTGENVRFTRNLLEKRGLNPSHFILVQKPYMERRTYATFKKVWPEKDAVVTSPQIPFAQYPTAEISQDAVINIMLGDLQRIKLYAEKGFQIPQEIPGEVWEAFQQLVAAGYTDGLIDD